MSQEIVNELSSYISLLVREAGGEVRIPYEVVEAGLPSNGGVKVELNPNSEELVFRFVEELNEQS